MILVNNASLDTLSVTLPFDIAAVNYFIKETLVDE